LTAYICNVLNNNHNILHRFILFIVNYDLRKIAYLSQEMESLCV